MKNTASKIWMIGPCIWLLVSGWGVASAYPAVGIDPKTGPPVGATNAISSTNNLGLTLQQADPVSGYVIKWGWNPNTAKAMPARVVLNNAVSVSAGRLHCLALNNDGTVAEWVWNAQGDPSFTNPLEASNDGVNPTVTIAENGLVKMDGRVLTNIISVAAGDQFSLALKRDGTVVSWGKNSISNCPSNVVAIAAASLESLAVRQDGTVVEWVGAKYFFGHGQINDVPDLTNAIAMAIGATYQGTRNVALKSDGTVAHWGSESTYKEATPPAGLNNVVAVAAGAGHSLALKNDGTIIGWGFNDVGQATGVPTKDAPHISNGPVVIGGQILSNVVSVAADDNYSMALKKDGTVVAWGKMVNNLYPVTVPSGLNGVVAIAAGDSFCLAIITNRAVAERFMNE